MIVVEDILTTLFNDLPEIVVGNDCFKSIFEFGDVKDLNEFLKQEEKKYPLIWLESGFNESFNDEGVSISPNIVIATYGLNTSLGNRDKLDINFKVVLIPVLELVLKTFERSNVVVFNGDYKITKYYNYGDMEAHETTDIWDAIKLELDITLKDDCIKKVNYG